MVIKNYDQLSPEVLDTLHPMCQRCLRRHLVDKNLAFEINCRPLKKDMLDFDSLVERYLAEGQEEEEALWSAYKIHIPRFAEDILDLPSWHPIQEDLFLCTATRIVGRVHRRAGKALDLSTPILTVGGWKTMGTLEAGDRVYGPDGSPTRVEYTSEIFLGNRCYEVEFSDGSVITADAEHLWTLWDTNTGGKGPAEQTMTTAELAAKPFKWTSSEGKNAYRYRVPCNAALETPERPLPIDPYIFGYWLGDGVCREPELSVGNNDLAHVHEAVTAAGYQIQRSTFERTANVVRFNFEGHCAGTKGSGMRGALGELGVLQNKHIPEAYLLASREQRLALLAGLMDSDGTISARDHRSRGAEWCSTDLKLAKGFMFLLRSLGIKASLKSNKAKIYGRAVGNRYRVSWVPTFDPFRMKRKSDRFKAPKNPHQYEWVSLVDVREVPSVPTRCIEVDHPSHLYLAGRMLIPTHNTVGSRVRVLHRCFFSDTNVLVVAPYEDQIEEFFGGENGGLEDIIMHAVKKNPWVLDWVVRPKGSKSGRLFRVKPRYKMEFITGAVVQGKVLRSTNSKRGSSARGLGVVGLRNTKDTEVAAEDVAGMVVIDESDYLEPSDWATINPIIEQNKSIESIEMSTPAGKREAYHNHCFISPEHREIFYPITQRPDIAAMAPEDRKRELERIRRSCQSEDEYVREWMAEPGLASATIFRPEDLLACSSEEWDYTFRAVTSIADCAVAPKPEHGHIRMMGVDWNRPGIGVRIYVCEFIPGGNDGRGVYRMIDRLVVANVEFTQLSAADAIICANRIYRPHAIYCDSGFGDCVDPATLISTVDGIKRIADIERGDQVLTSDGQYHRVLDKIVRSDPKPTFEVKAAKCLPVRVSDTHPFLSYSMNEKFSSGRCIDESELGWKNVTELKAGDLVAIPKLDAPERSGLSWDLAKIVPGVCHDDEHVWFPTGFSSKPGDASQRLILNELGIPRITLARINRALRSGKELNAYQQAVVARIEARFGTYTPPIPVKTRRFIDPLDPAFLRLLGWYLSEGHANEKFLEFSQGSHRRFWIKNIKDDFLSCFGRELSESIGEDVRQAHYEANSALICPSAVVSALFRHAGGGARESKRIHPDLLRRWDRLGPMIRTLLLGDGSRSQSSWRVALTSLNVIDQVRSILISHGIVPNVYYKPGRKDNHRDQLVLDVSGDNQTQQRFSDLTGLRLYGLEGRRQRRQFLETSRYVLVPIRQISSVGDVRGLVDIEVDGVHDFVGNGVLLHNTQIEKLKQYGLERRKSAGPRHPDAQLPFIVKAINMQETLPVPDPAEPNNKDKARKISEKALMISFYQAITQERAVFFTKSERMEGNLIPSMNGYKVERVNPSGHPVYTGENDHDVVASGLALYAFWREFHYTKGRSILETAALISGRSLDDELPIVAHLPQFKEGSVRRARSKDDDKTWNVRVHEALKEEPDERHLVKVAVNGKPVSMATAKRGGFSSRGAFSSRTSGFARRR